MNKSPSAKKAQVQGSPAKQVQGSPAKKVQVSPAKQVQGSPAKKQVITPPVKKEQVPLKSVQGSPAKKAQGSDDAHLNAVKQWLLQTISLRGSQGYQLSELAQLCRKQYPVFVSQFSKFKKMLDAVFKGEIVFKGEKVFLAQQSSIETKSSSTLPVAKPATSGNGVVQSTVHTAPSPVPVNIPAASITSVKDSKPIPSPVRRYEELVKDDAEDVTHLHSSTQRPLSISTTHLKEEIHLVSVKKEPHILSEVDFYIEDLFFSEANKFQQLKQQGYAIGDRQAASSWAEAAFLGHLEEQQAPDSNTEPVAGSHEIYLNTHEPFCLATVGVQGAGKSHTLAVVLESCMLPIPAPHGHELVRLQKPMTALVLHYEQNVTSICEATGLISAPMFKRILGNGAALPRENMIVLVSPSYYKQRKAFYGDYCIVKPLLFQWASLSANHIKTLMRIKEGDNQLYVAGMLDLLRSYQRDAVVPDFQKFLKEVEELCSIKTQLSPLQQRAALLESLVAESTRNVKLYSEGADMSSVGAGKLVVADLTDPLLSSDEANGIFQVLTEQFRTCSVQDNCGKLLVLDEAHRFMSGVSTDGLSNAIVDAARMMRHDGMRLVVSTQSPKALAPELLELVSVAVLHRFHSYDWFTFLRAKVPLPDSAFEDLMTLNPGSALVFAARHLVAEGQRTGRHALRMAVRPRITADRGSSRKNAANATAKGPPVPPVK